MPDPFFKASKSDSKKSNNSLQKRKRKGNNINENEKSLKSNNKNLEEDVTESSEGEEGEEDYDSEENNETAEEKRLRLAKEYLKGLKEGFVGDELEVDAKEIDRDIITQRLLKDSLEAENKLYFKIAEQIPDLESFTIRVKKAHQLAVTCVEVDITRNRIITGSKDASIIIWDFNTFQKIHTFPGGRRELKKFEGHTKPILSMALSFDGKLLASGGRDNKIIIWDLESLNYKGQFIQHKDAVSGLTFRLNSYDLYSCSFDRTIKVWNAEEMSYIETLFGHQDHIYDIQALSKEQCVTSGARDKTVRLWKIIEQTQLVFRAGMTTKSTENKDKNSREIDQEENETKESTQNKEGIIKYVEGSVDKVCMLDEVNFISGGDSGNLCVWNTNKKKPSFTLPLAHGLNPLNQQPNLITAVACFPFTDLVASGSTDGYLRLWKANFGQKRILEPITKVPMEGFINSIKISTKDSKHHKMITKKGEGVEGNEEKESIKYNIVVGLGQESSYGRWDINKNCKNRIVVVEVPLIGNPKSV
ncbi:WD40 repeat-like protein [Neoconidiobolus thromboides FSU 785]|nr:WD40 repeat-like protein [Neoconidiobolus thromboides FSU 785]